MEGGTFDSHRRLAIVLLVALMVALGWMAIRAAGASGEGLAVVGPGMAATAGNAGTRRAMAGDSAGRMQEFGTQADGGAVASVDAGGRRFNDNGDLIGEPARPAKPLPVDAIKGEVIGYATGRDGQVTPIHGGSDRVVPNAPGTYVAVDMWADGGPQVVAPRQWQPAAAGATQSQPRMVRQ